MIRKLIGDRAFYRHALAIALPIILQNLITNFVSLLDNIMVGQLDTAQISAVTIVNTNLLFIFILCLFGGAAGAGIFTTQFYGSEDLEGIRHTFRFKLFLCLGVTAIGCCIFGFFAEPLIGMYLQGEGDPAVARDTLHYSKQYMYIMLIGLLPFAITTAYAGTLRECGHPTVPMVASMIATGVNLIGNYILIFGHFGAPRMGVAGAAIATVIARYVEMLIVVLWTHLNPDKCPYVKGLYRSLYIPRFLLWDITRKGLPLLMNECLWSVGMAILNQSYSYCGLDVLPALSIAITIYDLTAVVFRSLGNTVGILMGQMMGAGRSRDELHDHNNKLIALCVVSGTVFGLVAAALSGWFPTIYNTTDSVRQLATWMILIWAITSPIQAYTFPVYFTLRSGGKTFITFLFDCGFVWLATLPAAYLLSRFSGFHIIVIFSLCQLTDVFKAILGFFMIRSGIWIQNLTAKQ